MNSVSWFIYLSDVLSNIQPAIAIGGVFTLIGAGICLLGWVIEEWDAGPKYARRLFFGALPVLLVSCLIPSKTTMYAIAASQIGETVVASPEAREMIDDTKQILRDYLKSLKKDGGK